MKSFCYVVNFLIEGTTADFAVAKKHFPYPPTYTSQEIEKYNDEFRETYWFFDEFGP